MHIARGGSWLFLKPLNHNIMSKYIDADKLITEINRRMNENCELAEKTPMFAQRAVEDYGILAFIEALQQEQPEVDLEKEAVSFCFDNGINISPGQAKNIVRHFYELGLKARKEE